MNKAEKGKAVYCCVVDYEGPTAIFSTKGKAIKHARESSYIDAVEIWYMDTPSWYSGKTVWRKRDE